MKAFNSFVAACRNLGEGRQEIRRVVAATDSGYAVNPARIERQISGSFVCGLSALFEQECTIKDGACEQTNFHNYNSMRIAGENGRSRLSRSRTRRRLSRDAEMNHGHGRRGAVAPVRHAPHATRI